MEKDFEIVDYDEILNLVNQTKRIIQEDTYNSDSIEDLKKDYPCKIKKLDETLLKYIGGKDLKILKIEFPDNWKHLIKNIAFPYEYFKNLDDYQKTVDNLKKEDLFSKLKNDYPSDKEGEKTKEISNLFNVKNGEHLSHLYLRSDVLLLACVFEKVI